MNEPTHIAALLPPSLRQRVQIGDLPPRPEYDNLTPEEQSAFYTRQALAYHARATPPLFRDAHADRPEILAWAGRFVANPESAGSLLLTGQVGTGKTHLAYGALRAIAESGRPAVRWTATTEGDLYSELRAASRESADALFARYADAPVLLLDDIGTAKTSEWTTSEALFRLVEHRYRQRLPMILTTNLTVTELSESVGERITSRLASMCTVVEITGEDRRMP